MSGEFYQVLFYSLLLTAGGVLTYFGYRFLIARLGITKVTQSKYKYITLYNLEKGAGRGEVVFYFNVPEKTTVNLEILDLNDALLKEIIRQEYEAGDFRVKFNTLELPNGTYFYRIKTDHQQTTKKFVIENEQD